MFQFLLKPHKFFWLVCLIIFSSNFVFTQEPIYDIEYKYSPKKLQEDFNVLLKSLKEVHPDLYWYAPENEFESLADSIQKLLDKPMNEQEFYKLLTPLVAKINCGHTVIDPSYFYQSTGQRLPLDLIFIEDKVYIRDNYSEDKSIKIGSEVLSINGENIQDIIAKILPSISGDGLHKNGKYIMLEDDFQNLYYFLVAKPDTFSLDCIEYETQKKVQYTIPASDDYRLQEFGKRLVMYLEENPALEFKIYEEYNKTALLKIHSFYSLDIKSTKQKFRRFLKKSFKEIFEQNIEHLIIDLRDNSGGDILYAGELFSYITENNYVLADRIEVSHDKEFSVLDYSSLRKRSVRKPKWVSRTEDSLYIIGKEVYNFLEELEPKKTIFKGKVYVLINNGSFSSSGLFAMLTYNRATLIGQETSAGIKGFNGGDFMDIALPNTQLLLDIPMEKWVKTISDYPDKTGGIKPHIEIKRNIKNIVEKKDVELEKAFELIKTKP